MYINAYSESIREAYDDLVMFWSVSTIFEIPLPTHGSLEQIALRLNRLELRRTLEWPGIHGLFLRIQEIKEF